MRDDPFTVHEDEREDMSSSMDEEDEDDNSDDEKIDLDLSQSNLNDLESKFDTENLTKDDDFIPLEKFPPIEKAQEDDQLSRGKISYFSVVENSFTIEDLWTDPVYRLNLIIMIMAWSASSFCFYVIGFYIKYIPGNVFNNAISTGVAGAISSISVGIIV